MEIEENLFKICNLFKWFNLNDHVTKSTIDNPDIKIIKDLTEETN